jgi:DNA-binding NarL/FixJ family response regulator
MDEQDVSGSGPGGSNGGLNLVLVDDHVALRKGIELLLRREGWSVVGVAGNADEGYQVIRSRRPDVAVIDIALPGENGVALTERLLRGNPDLGVLLYTGLNDHEELLSALDCGARGFALKAGPPEELMAAVRAVGQGGEYLDPRLRPLVLARSATERVGVHSPREREVLHLLAEGMTGEQVAERLVISTETVRTHVRNAMAKLEANTRVHAIAIALRQGEIVV